MLYNMVYKKRQRTFHSAFAALDEEAAATSVGAGGKSTPTTKRK
jgi:hypothetical protein